MKNKSTVVLMLSFAIVFSASAQKNRIRFQSMNQFGIVGGENQVNTAFQTVNGLKYSNFFSGIGIGLDYYRYRTLPLFFDERWYFGDDKKGFVYGDIGYNFPVKDKPEKEISYYTSYHFTGGVYTDFGIGYQVHVHKKSSMVFSLGYSYKKLKIRTADGPNPFDGYTYENYNYSFNRMILKAGLVF